MKRALRFFALLLTVTVLTGSLTSCSVVFRLLKAIEYETVLTNNPFQSPDSRPEPDEKLAFTLTQRELDDFAAELKRCESLFSYNTDAAEIEKSENKLDRMYEHFITQEQIAYLLFCMNQSDPTASEQYLFASAASSEAYADYMAMCKRLYRSGSPCCDVFFADWTQEELTRMSFYTEELNTLNQEIDRILVRYRNLGEDEFERETPELFLKLTEVQNRIATLNGFSDYIEYAYQVVYSRDYVPDDVEQIRCYVRTYLVPLCKQTYEKYANGFGRLSRIRQNQLSAFICDPYDRLKTNYLTNYLQSCPVDMRDAMSGLFVSGFMIRTDETDAFKGAFTGYLYEYGMPFCYFGPGYQSTLTVAHELGHYYAELCRGDGDIFLDLHELQSQGNEWMLTASMKNDMNADMYRVLVDYLLYDTLASIIICIIVDDFEQTAYRMGVNPGESLDDLMNKTAGKYDFELVRDYIIDPKDYWRYVVIESPAYYISYAVSGIAALELYSTAVTDTDAAREIYRKLTEAYIPDAGFLKTLESVGLSGPFKESVYASKIVSLTD